MNEGQSDTIGSAMMRLEAALDRLGHAMEARRAATPPIEGDMVPKAALAALAARLDTTIARLRANLEDQG